MRGEASIEGALYVKAKNPGEGNNNRQNYDIFQPCAHCKKTNHHQIRCWWRPDVKCRKCGNMGHVERVCRSKSDEANISMEQQEEDLLFVAKCFATSNSSCDSWFIDSGCKNHITDDHKLFKELDKIVVSKVKIGSGDFISVKGKGTVAIESLSGMKYIIDVSLCMTLIKIFLVSPNLLKRLQSHI